MTPSRLLAFANLTASRTERQRLSSSSASSIGSRRDDGGAEAEAGGVGRGERARPQKEPKKTA